jgi:hypothetical protein
VQLDVAFQPEAGVEFDQPVQTTEQCALARAGWTHQTEHPLSGDAEIHVAK